jgi:hypothetical protein
MNQKKKQLTVIESLIVHSKVIIALRLSLHQLKKSQYIISLLPVYIPGIDEIMNDIRSKIKEREMAISRFIKPLFNGIDFDLDTGFYASYSNLEKSFIFLNKTLERDKRGVVTKTTPYILFLQDFKEIKAGDVKPHHECKDILKDLPKLEMNNLPINLDLLKSILNYHCSTLEKNKL